MDTRQSAFDTLKKAIAESITLALPRYDRSWILDTDASDYAIGAVLSQIDDNGREHPVCFASKNLDKRQTNYCVTRRELYAVVYFLKHFRNYILGPGCLLRTDHSAILWLKRIKEPDGQQARWLDVLEEFSDTLTIQHRAGLSHGNADAMSRRPCDKPRCCKKSVDPVDCLLVNSDVRRPPPHNVNAGAPSDLVGDTTDRSVAASATTAATIGQEQSQFIRSVFNSIDLKTNNDFIFTEQRKDPELCELMNWLPLGQKPPDYVYMSWSPETKALLSQFERLTFNDNNALCRRFIRPGSSDIFQVVIPKPHQAQFLKDYHIAHGHLGKQRLKAAIQQRAYWPGWSSAIDRLYRSCLECCAFKRGLPAAQTELRPILAGDKMEIISVDLAGPFPASKPDGFKYILAVQDMFTKFIFLFPLQRITAEAVAEILVNRIFMTHSFVHTILSDQGLQFDCQLLKSICEFANIHKVRCSPYHASTNGMIERLNRTLHSMMAKVVSDNQTDWHLHLSSISLSYNCTVHRSTGFTPFRLMYGTEACLVPDLEWGLGPQASTFHSYQDYVDRQTDRQMADFQLVREHLHKAAKYRKRHYDANVKPREVLKLDDKVWYY